MWLIMLVLAIYWYPSNSGVLLSIYFVAVSVTLPKPDLEFVWSIATTIKIIITNNKTPRLGYLIYQAAIKAGILLRPLGNTIYWLPPLNITDDEIEELKNKTMQVLLETT